MDLWFAMELVEYPTSIFDNEDFFLVYFSFLSSSALFGAGSCR